ncbi:MAG: glycosyltransferase EpsD [Carnobacterium sp.]|uniref:glycosyltransferase family 4 protein n=1 Tax=Carnobacterium sp. TaxID=48221 RepID=UPI002647F6DE|nr:glycosyltransferase family 4 protein [Carnobacterium sp.]MDN5372934.1 glycosyltransferase EpsD [Carnobacterium sp.]
MKKVLLLASVSSMIEQFNRLNIELLQELGCEVHVITSFGNASNLSSEKNEAFKKELKQMNVTFFDVPISRSTYSFDNFKAYQVIKKILKEQQYQMIHCQSPVGGIITRMAARKLRVKGTKVLYTAHGFHFYEGAPLLNWLIYYPLERYFAKYTDCLITINQEDFRNAKEKKLKTPDIQLINGVGVDLHKFNQQSKISKQRFREQLKIGEKEFLLINVAELNKNKNQIFLINSMEKLTKKIPNIRLLLIGKGDLKDNYMKRINELNLADNIKLLGYRQDITTLMGLSDVCVSSSKREGLPVNIIESMATGIPVVAVKNRGSQELIEHGVNGYLCSSHDSNEFEQYIEKIWSTESLIEKMGIVNRKKAEKYSEENVYQQLKIIYSNYLAIK